MVHWDLPPSLVALKSPGPGAISAQGGRRVRWAAAGAERGRVGPLPGPDRRVAGRDGSY